MGIGTYKTAYFEEKSDNEAIEKYEVWYPEELENSSVQYPVVIVVNGTGVFASKAKPLFEHLASWGFIVIGNQDPSTWNGNTADMTLQYIIEENNNEDSIFYKRVDKKISALQDIHRVALQYLMQLMKISMVICINVLLVFLQQKRKWQRF